MSVLLKALREQGVCVFIYVSMVCVDTCRVSVVHIISGHYGAVQQKAAALLEYQFITFPCGFNANCYNSYVRSDASLNRTRRRSAKGQPLHIY